MSKKSINPIRESLYQTLSNVEASKGAYQKSNEGISKLALVSDAGLLKKFVEEKIPIDVFIEKYINKKKESDEPIKIKKSQLKKLIKKGFEDGLFKEKKRDSLMKLYEEKDYDKIISYLDKKGLITGEGFTKGSPEAKAHAEKMRKAKSSKRERSPSPEPKKESKEKIEVVKGIATATKKGKTYNIKAKSGINKDLPQEVINEGSKLLRDSIDDHIKIKYFHPDYKNDKKKYRWV